MIRRCVLLLLLLLLESNLIPDYDRYWILAARSWTRAAADDRGYNDDWSFSKNDLPLDASLSSRRFVQSQSQQAQGSVPFS